MRCVKGAPRKPAIGLPATAPGSIDHPNCDAAREDIRQPGVRPHSHEGRRHPTRAAGLKQGLRLYPPAQASRPPELRVINLSGKVMDMVHADNIELHDETRRIVQEESVPGDSNV